VRRAERRDKREAEEAARAAPREAARIGHPTGGVKPPKRKGHRHRNKGDRLKPGYMRGRRAAR
jgi:hypothetical protein